MQGLMNGDAHGQNRAIAVWLLVLCAMVFFMVVLGGLTRLTHSGLSMVVWKPVVGWFPPLSMAEWEGVFDNYRQTPEYLKINQHMTLEDFKSIFWFEYAHRLWGRIIGLAFAVPFVVFLLRGWIGWQLAPRLLGVFLLGALQGGLGWYMVKSGLVDRPDVSQYRLTAHLAAALLILGYMLWVALGLLGGSRRSRSFLAPWAAGIAGLVFVAVLSGGFVAGLDAGFVYNTFPLMDGQLVPDVLFAMDPFYLNFFENIVTVQFDHRVLTMVVLAAVMIFWVKGRRLTRRQRRVVHVLAALVVLQVSLGILTLILVVPLALAAVHQAVAVLLFAAAVWNAHELGVLEKGTGAANNILE